MPNPVDKSLIAFLKQSVKQLTSDRQCISEEEALTYVKSRSSNLQSH